MSQTRRHISSINESLKSEYSNLKATKDDLMEHINTLVKRQKQLNTLKTQLERQLARVQQNTKTQRKNKAPLCSFLRQQLNHIGQKHIESSIHLKNLQKQYEFCLQDYDKVLITISTILEDAHSIQSELKRLKQSDVTLKAMILDCQRLKRVLEEQKKYFKGLTFNQQKSHHDRLKELQSILKKLGMQHQNDSQSSRIAKIKIGCMKINCLMGSRFYDYCSQFFRPSIYEKNKMVLGIQTFKNCLEIAGSKTSKKIKQYFSKWHNQCFPKDTLSKIVQKSLTINNQTRQKIKVLNKMQEKTASSNLALLHLYQKMKYLVTLSNKCHRKDQQIGFNVWRKNCQDIKSIENVFKNVINITIPTILLRNSFQHMRKVHNLQSRFQTASILLDNFQTTKQLARIFRRWRFQTIDIEMIQVKKYLRNCNDRQKIMNRVKYEKRKQKALVLLNNKMTKVRLRNYFTKYWMNIKNMKNKEIKGQIDSHRENFSDLRKENQKLTAYYNQKDRGLLLIIFRNFIYKNKILPYYKQWRAESQLFRKQKKGIFSLVIRKEAKNKISVMNQFRRNVQFYQKKEMHQVLTDLNKKMQKINELSTDFRQKLKNCIQNLGVIASQKMNNVTQHVLNFQKRILYTKYIKARVQRTYRYYLLNRMQSVQQVSIQRVVLSQIKSFVKEKIRESICEKILEKYLLSNKKRLIKNIFSNIHSQLIKHKSGFAKLIHVENVLLFFRQSYAFHSLKNASAVDRLREIQKELEAQNKDLQNRNQNLKELTGNRVGLEQSLKNLFTKFCNFQNRKETIKNKQRTGRLLKNYFERYRAKVDGFKDRDKVLLSFNELTIFKQNQIFFRNLLLIRNEQIIHQVKQQLAKINKKRKTLEQKISKSRIDIDKRFQQDLKIFHQYQVYYNYYTKRYEDVINFFKNKHFVNDQLYYKRQIFITWKYEYISARRMCRILDKMFVDRFRREPVAKCIKAIKDYEANDRSAEICAQLLEKKGKRWQKDTMYLWKLHIKDLKRRLIAKKIANIDQYESGLRKDLHQTVELINRQFPRVSQKKLMVNTFMAFKNPWLKARDYRYRIAPITEKLKESYLKLAMKGWKWLMYYKKTKRRFLAYKKQQYEFQLKKDVFLSLKIYREELYFLAAKMNIVFLSQWKKVGKFSFNKIQNKGANERDQLNYERRRAVFRLAMQKQSRQKMIKKKILAKWHAWLIPKDHYLPTIMKRIQLQTLKKAFANINQNKYWNSCYIKDYADEVTTVGYADVNSVTNSLMREGYDPDEIKNYLKMRNNKDVSIVDKTMKHIKAWSTKQNLVRAFHSWQQYLTLKIKIKTGLKRVLNIAGGLGRYFSRWRSKDPHFNQILKQQSRGNMLQRYKELSRLLKQYRRDIRDSDNNLQQLIQINNQYKGKTKVGVMMALNALSNSVKKGLRQGMLIWRQRIGEARRMQMDDRHEQMTKGVQTLVQQRQNSRYRIAVLRQHNRQLKQKCAWGVDCGKILENLLTQKDTLSINLADKEHNLKLLLEDNLRLKQKVKMATQHAQNLISKVQEQNQ